MVLHTLIVLENVLICSTAVELGPCRVTNEYTCPDYFSRLRRRVRTENPTSWIMYRQNFII